MNEELETNLETKPKSRARYLLAILAGIILLAGTFQTGLSLGKKGFYFEPKDFKVINAKDAPQEVDYGLLWQTLGVLRDKYIGKPINEQEVLYGAVRGAVAAAGDQYTEFFDPAALSEFNTELDGNFEGIGAEIGKKDNNIIVISPLEDSPAAKAGLLPKDIIVAVDGEQTAEWTVSQTVTKIRGQKGTEVTLTIFREGRDKTFDIKIKRDNIQVKSVKYNVVTSNGKKVAVISIRRFANDTKQLFVSAVNDLKTQGVSGIVVDVRNDPGGYLETAVDLASFWVETGKLVVSEQHSTGKAITYNSEGPGVLSTIKTVVLINGGSASASEILAGVLQDYSLAELVGEKSFGKGSVQELINLPGGSALKVTVAKWITPNGKNLNKDGLNPNVVIKLTEEDYIAGRDPQMDKALEIITK